MKKALQRRRVLSLLPILPLLTGLFLSGCASHEHDYTLSVIAPTCTTIGYTIHTCECGDTFYSDYRSKTAHAFSEWETETEPDLIYKGEEFSRCKVCGELRIRETPNLSALTKLYFTLGENGGVTGLLFDSPDFYFSCGAALEVRNAPEKPDYSLSMYHKADNSAYFTDLGWGERSTYCLYGRFTDPGKCRNRAGASLWNAVSGASDGCGIPVQLYINDVYKGLYELLPEDQWRYAADAEQNEKTASLLAGDESCLFTEEPVFSRPSLGESSKGFSFLHCTTDSTEWAEKSFSEFCAFIRDAKESEFVKKLSEYTDPQALIDYYLTNVVLCVGDRLETGTVWYTADGKHWLPTFSDLSHSLGITVTGSPCWHVYNLPVKDADGNIFYNGGNLLWQRLVSAFREEIGERYALLRLTVFSTSFVYGCFETASEAADPLLLEKEKELYPESPEGPGSQPVSDFVALRLENLDQLFLGEAPFSTARKSEK